LSALEWFVPCKALYKCSDLPLIFFLPQRRHASLNGRLGAVLPSQTPRPLSSASASKMGLSKHQPLAKFEVAIALANVEMIKRTPKFWGAPVF